MADVLAMLDRLKEVFEDAEARLTTERPRLAAWWHELETAAKTG